MRSALLAAIAGALAVAAPASAADVVITTPGKQFSPARVTAVPGDTVTWRNVDVFDAHDIRASDGSFDSGRLGRMQAFTQPVSGVGTMPYLCSLHLGMTGAIDVVPAVLDAPAGEAVAGAPVALTGRAPAGDVALERQDAGGWVEVARARTAADGTFSATVTPAATAAWRAVGAAGAGPAVTVAVTSQVRVAIKRTATGVTATATPAPKGLRAVFQLYSRERFMWRAAGSRALPASGRVSFRARKDLRRRARVVLRRADGTEVARSGELALWKRGPASQPKPDAPRGDHGGHGEHAHH